MIGGFKISSENVFNPAKQHFLRADAFRLPMLPDISGDVAPGHKEMVLSVCSRPEILPLIRSIEFRVIGKMNVPFRVPSADEIHLNTEILAHHSLAALFIRHAIEIAIWQSKMSVHAPLSFFLSIAVLSANTAKLYWESMTNKEQRFCLTHMPEKFRYFFDLVRNIDLGMFSKIENKEERRSLIKDLLRLQDMDNVLDSALTEECFDETDRSVKQGLFIAAPSEYLLTQGGDCRLQIDRISGLNGYGCSPKPRPWAITFSSSTATSISGYAFSQVEILREKLIEAVCRDNVSDQYIAEVEGIRSRILEVFGLKDVKGAEVVLTTSGTDAELFALFLAGCEDRSPVTNILVGPEETGSGVPLSASGRHFDARTPLGNNVCRGEIVEGLPGERIRLLTVPLRNYDSTLLSLDSIDSRVKTLAGKAIADGNRVLVHLVESSKTGLSAPSFNALKDLKDRYGSSLDVLVDACQLRTGRKRLKQYLEAGFMISMTGSKFYTGPPFSGALLLSPDVVRRIRDDQSIPAGFIDYFTSYELPQKMQTAKSSLRKHRNVGLLLRWEAALWEIAAFQGISDKHKYLIFALFGESIRESIASNPDLELVSLPALERWKLPDGEEWDWLPTIFTFTMSRPGRRGMRRPIYLDEARRIYQWLNMDISMFLPKGASEDERRLAEKRCHIGQPVKIALNGNQWVGALRISAGARLISGVCSDPGLGRHFAERLSREIGDACSVLDKISLIIKYLDYIRHHFSNKHIDDESDRPEHPYMT